VVLKIAQKGGSGSESETGVLCMRGLFDAIFEDILLILCVRCGMEMMMQIPSMLDEPLSMIANTVGYNPYYLGRTCTKTHLLGINHIGQCHHSASSSGWRYNG